MDIWSCGVILYALLCGYLPFDDQNVNILFKKIKAGYFQIPAYLSEGAADLLRSLLQGDPVQRITIQQIKDHEWFQQDLPEYLFPESNQDNTRNTIDPAVVSEVCQKLGVKMQEVVEAIQNGDSHNQLYVAYNLVLDNMAMTHPEALSTPSTDRVSTVDSKRFVQAFTSPKTPHKPPKPQWPPNTSYAIYNPRLYQAGFKCRWHLGIQSQSRPQDIMAVIFHKMRGLNYYWKIISPYHVLVKYDLPNKENCSIKLDLQLYQVDKRTYLLDIKDVLLRGGDLTDELVEKCGLKDELKHMQSRRHYTMEFLEISSLLIQSLVQ